MSAATPASCLDLRGTPCPMNYVRARLALETVPPGGWLQVSLFFLICGGIILIAFAVWYSSKKKRAKRAEAGLDPVSLARAKGQGVRAPSPLDKAPSPSPETASPETASSETAGSENAGQDS